MREITPFFIILLDEHGNIITDSNNQTLQQNFVSYAGNPKSEGRGRELFD